MPARDGSHARRRRARRRARRHASGDRSARRRNRGRAGSWQRQRGSDPASKMLRVIEENTMRKIVIGAFVSVDGVMQAPGGPDEDPTGGFTLGGWLAPHFDATVGAALGQIF